MDNIIENLIETRELITVKRGETIYRAGEKIKSFFYIKKGTVKIADNFSDGRTRTVSLNETYEFIGYLDYLKGKKEFTKHAVAMTDCILYSLPIELLHNSFIRENFILNSMVQQLEKTEQLNFALSTMKVSERLRWFLLKMAKRKDGVLRIEIPLTHEDIANYLGCSRQKISTFMREWKKEGAIEYENGFITILDAEKIQ